MSIPQEADSAPEPVPFFTDPRTLIQKLNVKKRDWIPTKPAESCPPIIHDSVDQRPGVHDQAGITVIARRFEAERVRPVRRGIGCQPF